MVVFRSQQEDTDSNTTTESRCSGGREGELIGGRWKDLKWRESKWQGNTEFDGFVELYLNAHFSRFK